MPVRELLEVSSSGASRGSGERSSEAPTAWAARVTAGPQPVYNLHAPAA